MGGFTRVPASGSIADDVWEWNINGAVTTGTFQDGSRAARSPGTIVGVIVTVKEIGDQVVNPSTIFDINKHVPTKPITTQRNNTAGVTIYTTQANRPTITGDTANPTHNGIIQATAPDVTAFAAGDFFSVDVDQATDDEANDATVHVFVRYD